ncbi:MAG: YegS/Rv2252/BmrU family lipid kinase [Planctomycetota bacterium]
MPRLGIVPLGTGNDFVRSLNYPQDVLEVLALLDRGATRPVDAIEVSTPEGEHVCLNVASAGAAGALAEEIDAASKQRWGPLAYVWNGVARALGAQPFGVELRLDGTLAFQGEALNLVVANGAFAGGGYKVAPEAQVDDGLLEVHLIRPCGTLRRCDLVARLAAGTLEASDVVESFRARRIELRTTSEQPLNLDGEPAGRAQAFGFKARSAALRVIVP